MFLKCSTRHKDGKTHRSWSIVESRRVGRHVVQQHVLYLGEVTDRQRASWERAVSVIDETNGQCRQLTLIPEDRAIGAAEADALPVRLSALRLEHPRQWGACWLADGLWRELHLDKFFAECLGCSREDTAWEKVLRTLTIYRLLSPGSEWRLHRHWFATTAVSDLLGVDERAVQPAHLNGRPCSADERWLTTDEFPSRQEAVFDGAGRPSRTTPPRQAGSAPGRRPRLRRRRGRTQSSHQSRIGRRTRRTRRHHLPAAQRAARTGRIASLAALHCT